MNLLNLSLIKIISWALNYSKLLKGSISKPKARIQELQINKYN